MKYILFLFVVMPFFVCSQVSKSINQTFSINNAESVIINLNSSDINIKYIEGTRILVETQVKMHLNNANLADFLIQQGRYDLTKEINPNTHCLTLKHQKERNLIIIKGEKLNEEISYTIYIPNKIAVVNLAKK